jgi:hypothetical protein
LYISCIDEMTLFFAALMSNGGKTNLSILDNLLNQSCSARPPLRIVALSRTMVFIVQLCMYTTLHTCVQSTHINIFMGHVLKFLVLRTVISIHAYLHTWVCTYVQYLSFDVSTYSLFRIMKLFFSLTKRMTIEQSVEKGI